MNDTDQNACHCSNFEFQLMKVVECSTLKMLSIFTIWRLGVFTWYFIKYLYQDKIQLLAQFPSSSRLVQSVATDYQIYNLMNVKTRWSRRAKSISKPPLTDSVVSATSLNLVCKFRYRFTQSFEMIDTFRYHLNKRGTIFANRFLKNDFHLVQL